MKGFLHITQVVISSAAIKKGQEFLRSAGQKGAEGIVLWIGRPVGNVFHVLDALIPPQRPVRTGDGICAIVESAVLHALNVNLYRHNLRLIAQVHSHPGEAYHSGTDDELPIATTAGCLSVVVPDFARRSFRLPECAVYRLDATGTWRYLEPSEVTRLIRIEEI